VIRAKSPRLEDFKKSWGDKVRTVYFEINDIRSKFNGDQRKPIHKTEF